MDNLETRRLEMFLRVRRFGAARAASFPASSRGAEVLAVVGASIAELEAQSSAQVSGASAAREGTARKAVALEALREDLEAINHTARAMALTMPGLDDKFRLPRNAGTQAWLTAARAFASDAEPLKDEFTRRGLPADFLEDLAADISVLEEAIGSRTQNAGASVAATVAIDEAIERGMSAVRELDAVVRNVFRDDPAALAEWTSASHTERPPRRTPATPTAGSSPGATGG